MLGLFYDRLLQVDPPGYLNPFHFIIQCHYTTLYKVTSRRKVILKKKRQFKQRRELQAKNKIFNYYVWMVLTYFSFKGQIF